MAAIFLRSQDFTVSGNEQANAPAARLTLDEPGLVFRSTTTTATLTATADAATFSVDTVALIGATPQASATVRVRAGSVADMSSGVLADVTQAAYSPSTPPRAGAIYLIKLPSLVSAKYVRIDVTVATGTFEASRLLIGQRIEVDGIDNDAEVTWISGSPEDGAGWTTVVDQRSRMSWKANAGNIKASKAFTEWAPFLESVGTHTAFLFVPNDASPDFQRQAGLVRQQSEAKLAYVTSDRYRAEMSLLEV